MFATLAVTAVVVGVLIAVCMKSDAIVRLGGGVTDIRGSIGGTTFSRGKGGNIARARMKPVNPKSYLQNTRRAIVAYLMKAWSGTLTEQERTDWRAYATGTSWTNRLGQSIEINGNAAFVRLNSLLLQIAEPLRTPAPTAMGHAGGVTIAFDAETDLTSIEFEEPGGAWVNDVDENLLIISMGIPVEAGHISMTKAFKYIGFIEGEAAAEPTYPLDIAAAYTMTAGQMITCRAMFIDPEMRVSGPFYFTEAGAPSV